MEKLFAFSQLVRMKKDSYWDLCDPRSASSKTEVKKAILKVRDYFSNPTVSQGKNKEKKQVR